MKELLLPLCFLFNRFLHIICTVAIAGGTLFYGVILPLAIYDLKPEQQLAVLARARWGFRAMVWTCAIMLAISGAISSLRLWKDYRDGEHIAATLVAQRTPAAQPARTWELSRAGWWWAAHASAGLVALCIAVALMTSSRQLRASIHMTALMVLIAVIFLGTLARHVRLTKYDTAPRVTRDGRD